MKAGFRKWMHWLVIYPLAGVGALVAILFIAMLFEAASSSSRSRTAISRMTSDMPYYEYGYTTKVQREEKDLAMRMKTWDSSYQIVPWYDLATSILCGDRPKSDYGSVYKSRKKCPGCHEQMMKLYYQEGWVTFCPTCRNQHGYKQYKR